MKLFLLCAFLIFFTLLSCNDEEIVDQEIMVKIYVETMIARDTLTDNSNFEKEKEKILNRYNVSDSSYANTLRNYKENKELWDEFFKESFEYLDTLRKRNDIK